MASPTPLPSRRAVLGGALVGLAAPVLGGCTRLNPFEPSPTEPDPPDVRAAERAAGRERRLLAAYDAALLIVPELADRLLPLRGDHVAHLAALGQPEAPASAQDGPTAAADPSAAPPGEPAPPPPPAVAPPRLPQDPAALLDALADLERRAATAHGGDAVRGGRGVGAVLASLSASEASHVVALT